jgi:plastocyanin
MRNAIVLAAATVVPLLAGCSDMSGPGAAPRVAMLDQCDSTSFNAALGAGSCKTKGSVTFSQFNAELSANKSVAAWRFSPSALSARVGQSIVVTNNGGEVHTFTEVENFGGGVVPSLNTASGNTTVAPECTHLVAEDFIQPGASHADSAETTVGTEHYQCCIHPWMRATVTVNR